MNENVGINQRSKEYVIVLDDKGKRIQEYRYVWIKHNREIPKGYMIHHKDGNKKNNSIENLQLVSRQEHGRLHRK